MSQVLKILRKIEKTAGQKKRVSKTLIVQKQNKYTNENFHVNFCDERKVNAKYLWKRREKTFVNVRHGIFSWVKISVKN